MGKKSQSILPRFEKMISCNRDEYGFFSPCDWYFRVGSSVLDRLADESAMIMPSEYSPEDYSLPGEAGKVFGVGVVLDGGDPHYIELLKVQWYRAGVLVASRTEAMRPTKSGWVSATAGIESSTGFKSGSVWAYDEGAR